MPLKYVLLISLFVVSFLTTDERGGEPRYQPSRRLRARLPCAVVLRQYHLISDPTSNRPTDEELKRFLNLTK